MEKESNLKSEMEDMPLNNPIPGHDPNPKPDPKFPNQTPNDGSLAMGSQTQTRIESEPPGNLLESQGSHGNSAMSAQEGSNPYVARTPAPDSSFSFKESVDTMRGVLERWGKRVGEATKKAEDLAGNTWQHLKTSPSLTEAAMGRIAQGTKVLAEGGYEKIFRQTFETAAEEQLLNSFACYLSTSAGPVMGVLYVSTAKLAFSSDNPLSYKSGNQTEWSYYKVVIPLHQLKSVYPSSSSTNSYEKYIQVISVDNHEFWFMGFLYYESAMESLQEALEARNLQTV